MEQTIFDAKATLFCYRAFKAYYGKAMGNADKAIEIAYERTDDMSDLECRDGERIFRSILKSPGAMAAVRDAWINQ